MKRDKHVISGFIICAALALAVLFSACSSDGESQAPSSLSSATEAPTEPPTEDPITKQLDGMSTDEKIGQLVVAGFEGFDVDETFASLITDSHIGGAILFSRNIRDAQQLCRLINEIKETAGSGIPLLIGMDEEGGAVTRLPDDVLSMPGANALAQQGNPETCYNGGMQIANQLKSFGLSTGFCPDLDIWSNPDNTVIGDRAYGTDAQSVVKYGIAAMKGLRDGGVVPVVKHFPGHGDTDADSHYSLPVITKTKEELMEQELIPFQEAVKQNVPAVMVGHLQCTQLDEKYPASLSYKIVQGLLRDELGFDGVAFTDDLTMGAVVENYSLGNACVLAVNAGCDMLLICHEYENVDKALTALKKAVGSGKITMDRLNEAVTRILKLKADYNITSETVEMPDVAALNERTKEFY